MGVKRSKQKINPPPHRVLYFRFDLFRNVTVGGGWGCSWCTPGSTEYVFPFRLENVCDKNVTNSAEDGTLAFIYFGGGACYSQESSTRCSPWFASLLFVRCFKSDRHQSSIAACCRIQQNSYISRFSLYFVGCSCGSSLSMYM